MVIDQVVVERVIRAFLIVCIRGQRSRRLHTKRSWRLHAKRAWRW